MIENISVSIKDMIVTHLPIVIFQISKYKIDNDDERGLADGRERTYENNREW